MSDNNREDIQNDVQPIQQIIPSQESIKAMTKTMANALRYVSNALEEFRQAFRPIAINMANFAVNISKLFPTDYMKDFAEILRQIKENPDSLFNYYQYEEQLNNYHWAWPYEISTDELKSLIETVNTEKEFDQYMVKFFSQEKLTLLTKELDEKLPSHHKILFRQVINAYNNRDYAIANNALLSILDNLLSDFLFKKRETKRVGILEPIVDFYKKSTSHNSVLILRLIMLSNNIDFVFEFCDFQNKISIGTNKQVRRHPSIHGYKFSNKKVDVLMLLNTISELLYFEDNLKLFFNSLYINKARNFAIKEEKKKTIARKIIKMYILECLEENKNEDKKGMTYQQIIHYLDEYLSSTIISDYHKEISSALQGLKNLKNSPITNISTKEGVLWIYNDSDE